jgi:hypothetical protein
VAEEIALEPDRVTAMLATLKDRWGKAEVAIETLTRGVKKPVEGAALRAALAELQGGISGALDATLGPGPGEFVAVDESAGAAVADEAVDAVVEVVRLRGELTRISATIDALSAVAASGSERDSPAAATESGPSERETSPRGE